MSEFSINLGVVIERREIDHPWQDYTYKPIAILPHAADQQNEQQGWRELQSGQDWVHFLAATLKLELHKGETEGYRYNLSQEAACVYVILRPGEEIDENEIEPFHVTVCPYEAMGYAESGDEIVEAVLMPEDMIAWVKNFIDAFHVDIPFQKRKNKKHRDQDPHAKHRGRPPGGSAR